MRFVTLTKLVDTILHLFELLVIVAISVWMTGIYLIFSAGKRFFRSMHPWKSDAYKKEREMLHAKSYPTWFRLAQELDELEENDFWRLEDESPSYHYDVIRRRLEQIRAAKKEGNIEMCKLVLRENLVRNTGGICNPALYGRCHAGTKILIENYVRELSELIRFIAEDESRDALTDRFIKESRQAFGRTALLLSGGASLGMYHFGVVKCLAEANLLPSVVCGASIGAIVAAKLGMTTDAELPQFFALQTAVDFSAFNTLTRGSVGRKLARFLKFGVFMDVSVLEQFCKDNLQSYTFKEAYERTGREINIVLIHTGAWNGAPNLLNHLTTPNVYLWSAACASCAQPGLYSPVNIWAKSFSGEPVILFRAAPHKKRVGIIPRQELPMSRLAEMFNVNQFIVSQVNPHIVPFLRTRRSSSRTLWAHRFVVWIINEALHFSQQFADVGILPKQLGWLKESLADMYEGHITIVPFLSLKSLPRALRNPSPEHLAWCMEEAERSTFPMLPVIRTRCNVEYALDGRHLDPHY